MKKLVIISVCLLAVGVAILLGALISVGFDFGKLSTVELTEKSYEAEGEFSSFIIDCESASFRLIPSEEGTRVIFKDRKDTEHTVAVSDGVLTVNSREPKRKWYENINVWTESESVKMYLESGAYQFGAITLVSGDVELSGDYAFGELGIESTSGDVRIASKVEDVLHVKTVSGDVDLNGIHCEEIVIETVSGDVELHSVVADRINIKTTSGDVELENCDGDTIELKTVSGDIEGELLSGKQFVASSISGDVRVPLSTTGGIFKATTTSGDIEIEIA